MMQLFSSVTHTPAVKNKRKSGSAGYTLSCSHIITTWWYSSRYCRLVKTWALSDRGSLASFCRFLSAVQITTLTRLTQFIYSPYRLIHCMPFHSSLFQCCHCDMNLKMDELYTGKQRWGEKNKRRKGRGSDACLASATNVFLSLMLRQLSHCSFERYFYEVTSVFTAVALVTADEYKEKSRQRGVWDRCHVLILRTAPAFSVTSLLSWHKNKPWTSTGRCWPLI